MDSDSSSNRMSLAEDYAREKSPVILAELHQQMLRDLEDGIRSFPKDAPLDEQRMKLSAILSDTARLPDDAAALAISMLATEGLMSRKTAQQRVNSLRRLMVPPDTQSKRASDATGFFEGRQFRPAALTAELLHRHHFICWPIDEAGIGVRLWVYENGAYRPGGADIARRLAHEHLGQASKPDRIASAVELVKETCKQDASALNTKAQDLINVQNGLLDWRSGELLPHSPDYLSTFQVQAEYLQDATSEQLDRFLTEVFPPDALPLAEEILGYLSIPTTKHQKAFMFVGEGANGKSTFLSMLAGFLGEDNVSHVSLQDLVENRFAAAELQGKLANIYADLPSSGLEQSDTFKAIVGGDCIKVERKFGQPFKLCATARLLFSANELPRSKDLSHAYFRRWIICPFPNQFEGARAKKDLLARLTTPEARSALLNRAVAGLRRLEQQQEFSACASVQEAGQAYRIQCDSAYEFIAGRLEKTTMATLGKKEVYEVYKTWCLEAGITYPASQKSFNRRLKEVLGASEGRHEGTRVWQGVAWKAETAE